MTLGWGIVGTGWAADALVGPAITADPDSELVAVASRTKDRAREFATSQGAKRSYGSFDALLKDPDVQAVYIATPNALHAEQATAAARAGKHVLCEKPLATTAADAGVVVEAARSAGVRLGTNFQARHYAPVEQIKGSIEAGEIGTIVAVQAESSPGFAPLANWRTDPELAGMGAVNNLAVHPLDLVRYLVGSEVTEVAALTNAGRSGDLETLALILLRFQNGVLAYVNGNQETPFPQPDVEIYGTKGSIIGRNCTYFDLESEVVVRTTAGERSFSSDTKDGFQRAVAAFRLAVVEQRPPSAAGEDGLRSVELVEGIARSVHEGAVVQL